MFQLARQAQRRHESSNNVRTTSSAHEVAAAGKRAMTDGLAPRGGGTPDFYGIARDSAMRELDAVRHTALPNYVSIRRKANMDPIAKEAELIKAAFQVRYLIDAANRHVRSLEKSETYADPMVKWLRARVEAVAAKALTLGCYDGAMDMRPRRFVDDSKPASQCSIEYKNHAHKKPQHVVAASKDSTLGTTPARSATVNPKQGNTGATRSRIARGTSSVPTAKAAPTAGAPSDSRPHANIRPGFRAV